MRQSLLALPLALLLSAAAADADQTLKFWEEGTRKGKPYQSSITMRSGPEGLRVDVTETEEGGSPEPFSILYLAREDRIAPVAPANGPSVSAAVLADLDARVKASGHARKPGRFTLAPLHTNHVVGKWTASAWSLKRPGQSTELIYFANPREVGIDDTTARNLKKMGDLFVPFINRIKLIKGEDLRESFNAYGLEQGFPVREFRAGGGVVDMDMQLVSVENADLSPELFRAPPSAPQEAAAKGPAPDHSLSVAAWIERGMPAPDRAWVMADYERAVEVLTPVAKEDATRLPRRESAASGDVFRRFVDPGNLTLGRSATMDAQMRLQADAGVMIGVGKLTLLYAGAYKGGLSFDEELVELMVYTLLVSREVVPLADDIVAKIPRDAPDRAVRLEGRAKMSSGLATIVSGCLDSLGADAGFRPAERLRLARALEQHLPALRPHLPVGARQELAVRLRTMTEAEKDSAVKDVLERVLAGSPKPRSKPA